MAAPDPFGRLAGRSTAVTMRPSPSNTTMGWNPYSSWWALNSRSCWPPCTASKVSPMSSTIRLGTCRSPPISCCGTPELREGLKCLEYVSDAPQAAREPRCHAAQDVFRLLIRASAFSGRGMVAGIPLAGGDGEVERERHDQDEPGQPVRVSDLAVLEAEAMGLEVREHRFDAPAPGVIERGEITRGLGHSDDPGLLVTGVLDEADVGAHLAGCQFHPRQVGCAPG